MGGLFWLCSPHSMSLWHPHTPTFRSASLLRNFVFFLFEGHWVSLCMLYFFPVIKHMFTKYLCCPRRNASSAAALAIFWSNASIYGYNLFHILEMKIEIRELEKGAGIVLSPGMRYPSSTNTLLMMSWKCAGASLTIDWFSLLRCCWLQACKVSCALWGIVKSTAWKNSTPEDKIASFTYPTHYSFWCRFVHTCADGIYVDLHACVVVRQW